MTGIFAVFFGASAIVNTYVCVTQLPMYSPSMWWFSARQLATNAVFIGLAWIAWRQPRQRPITRP